jgi:hypothetical protein
MTLRLNTSLQIALTVAAVTITPSRGDEVTLQNGDTLHGTVAKKHDDTLSFKLDGDGELQIPWNSIIALRTDEPITIITTNGNVITAPLSLTLDPRPQQLAATTPRLLREIDLIDPPAWRTGDGWHATGMLNFSISSQRGNNHSDDIDLDGRLILHRQRHRAQILADLENDRIEDVETSNKWLASADYDHFVSDHTFANLGTAFENNEAADLKLRSLIRIGLGHALIKQPVSKLEGKLLLNGITESYYISESQEYLAVGFEANLAKGLWEDTLVLYADLAGNVDVESPNRLLGKAWVGVRIPIRNGLMTSAEMKLEHDSQPAVDAARTDHTYRIKLGYAW